LVDYNLLVAGENSPEMDSQRKVLRWKQLPRRNERRFAAAHSIDILNLPMRVYVFATNQNIDRFNRFFRIDQSDRNI